MTQSYLEGELQSEQAHIDVVLDHLRRAMASAKGLVQESRARFTSNRESWLREEDGTALFERDAFAFLAAQRMAALDGEHEGLVFGRLDFTNAEKQYIGRLGVRTPDYEPLVIDWRATAAEPFYRATPVQPMDVVRRRVLTSRDDKVISIEDDVLMPMEVPEGMTVIGDGALMRALERARGAKMQDIVATIQAEQDEVIRAPHQGFTVITGGPGTGKTVVGLHRVAFLMYTHRRRFANGGVLVIGPSPVFIDYIERVLPSLGEESVSLQSIGEIAEDVLGFSSSIRDSDQAWIVKGGLHMVDALRQLVELPIAESKNLVVTVKGEPVSISAHQLAQIRRECLTRGPYNNVRSLAEAKIISFLWDRGKTTVPVDGFDQFEDIMRDSWAFSTFMDQWWPALEPQEVLSRLADLGIGNALDCLNPDQVSVLSRSIDPDMWTIADIPLLDELAELLGPVTREDDNDHVLFPEGMEEIVTISDRLTDERHLEPGTPHSSYAHVLVDEAQDITPIQWRMIHRRGANASWTIVGDPIQSCWPDQDEPMHTLEELMQTRQKRSFRLSTNYRSPKEAYDLATTYIQQSYPDIDFPQAVRSTGIAPRLLVASKANMGGVIADELNLLLDEVEGTVGVICESEHIDEIHGVLPNNPRVMLLDPISVKGLEFDAVIVIDPDGIVSASQAGTRTLYVALTRPTQVLVTVDIDHVGRWRSGLIETSKVHPDRSSSA